jgi:hypothetical protein
MGSGLSSNHRGISRSSLRQPPAARVVGADGSLSEFSAIASSPASVSDVLLGTGGNAGRFFVCSSDALYFDAEVPALGADELLRPGQIYFVLPAAMLGRPLSIAGMATLAVRASEALAEGAARRPQGRGRARGGGGFAMVACITPVPADGDDGEINEKLNQRTLGRYIGSLSQTRNDKRLALMTRPPIRRALFTIAEDDASVPNGGTGMHGSCL